MSKKPGGFTAHIDCMVISGFPGIGKTTTYNAMKKDYAGARCLDMDVRHFGTTNGMDVANPADYVQRILNACKDNACIFVTADRQVRALMQRAHLFYMIVAPEFPPEYANRMANYVPDLGLRARYMARFVKPAKPVGDSAVVDDMTARLLDGNGYTDIIRELFRDPMPHVISERLDKRVVEQAWIKAEELTRQVIAPRQLVAMQKMTPMYPTTKLIT